MTKQFGNLDKLRQLDGSIIGSKIDVHVAVLLDEVDHAVARNDHHTVKVLEGRLRDVKVIPRAYRSVKGDSDLASTIAPDN